MIRLPDWLDPWRANRELRSENERLARNNANLRSIVDMLDQSMHDANERYDRIRDANAQLRETLTLYRNEGAAAIEYTPRISGWPHNEAGTIRWSEPLPSWTPWPPEDD